MNTVFRRSLALLLGLTTLCHAIPAKTLTFDSIWQQVQDQSLMQQSAKLKLESASVAVSRSTYSFRPRVYADLRIFQTNDPGDSFFGLLEQRSVENSDFDPGRLNHGNATLLSRGALGVDFPFYEAGSKEAKTALYTHLLSAERFSQSQVIIEEYANALVAYAGLSSIGRNTEKLSTLKGQLGTLINGYQLGQKSNPVGYSGLLGMKSLLLHVEGLLDQWRAKEASWYALLSEMGVQDPAWIPTRLDPRDVIEKYAPSENNLEEKSYAALRNDAYVLASFSEADLEKTRFMPIASAFAESSAFAGNRSTELSYRLGANLQWLIYDPAEKGRDKELDITAQALKKSNLAFIRKEKAEKKQLLQSEGALKTTLKRLDQSEALLSEQIMISQTLFNNGSINALQFVDALKQKVDLISQRLETELALIQTTSTRLTKTPVDPTKILDLGGKQ